MSVEHPSVTSSATKSKARDIETALEILKDEWPKETGSDLDLSFSDVQRCLEKKLENLKAS